MHVDISSNATGEAGFLNEGRRGLNVEAGINYNACKSFYISLDPQKTEGSSFLRHGK